MDNILCTTQSTTFYILILLIHESYVLFVFLVQNNDVKYAHIQIQIDL